MLFDSRPHLKGQLIELRPLRAEDYAPLFDVARDPLIWEQHPEPLRYREQNFRAFFADALASGGALTTIDRASGRVVGSSRFHGFDARLDEVEIGWTFLARSHWGGAFNGEMKHLMLGHAFRFVSRVIFLIGPDNLRSRRASAKIGARLAGTRTDGGGRKSLVFVITEDDYRFRCP